MSKLIQQCQNDPSDKNKAKVQAYLNKHPMASCMLLPHEHALLATWGIK